MVKIVPIKSWLEQRLASTLRAASTPRIFRNIRDHATIENGFGASDHRKLHDSLIQPESDMLGDAGYLQGLSNSGDS